jgi:hypothetical protein
MMLGADISISHLLFRALLPDTLGTLVGGGFVIGSVYWYVFDSVDTITYLRERIRYGRREPAIGSRSPAFTPSTPLSTSLHNINVDNGPKDFQISLDGFSGRPPRQFPCKVGF